jgi:glycosyltransferase involved in cell wall biosynthesis
MSLDACAKALVYDPENELLKDLQKKNTELLKQMELSESMKAIKIQLEEEKDEEKLKHFVQALPEYMKDAPMFVRMKNKYLGKVKNNRVVIFCGYQNTPWSPASVKSGVGGSEEAVINMANELTSLGWLVDVYNYCTKPGNYDGVEYFNYWEYDNSMPCDVFIAWRNNSFIEYAPKDCKAKYVWCHDVQKPSAWIPERTERIDKIFVLSEFHRQNLPDIKDDKFFITRNGIDPKQFPLGMTEADLKRDPYKCIYASSPDRGLEHVLASWAEIKKAVPEATLDIYYGFTKHADEANRDNEHWHQFKAKIAEGIQQPGITWKGMVGHMELADAFLHAGLWLYPCHFDEISCITGMKAQASGAIPVYTDVGALPETVKYGAISGNPKDPEELKKWTHNVIGVLNGTIDFGRGKAWQRESMRSWAVGYYGWDQVALSWSELFKTTIALKGEAHVAEDKAVASK